MRVGIVGVGNMGRGFAKNLLEAGHDVRGYDRDARRLEELVSWGGTPAGSPALAAEGAERILTSLPDQKTVRAVTFGPDGILEGAGADLILVDTSTALPQDSRALARDLAEHGVRFVDACVSGTGATVMDKDVVVLAGGAAADFAACADLFAGFSRRAYHLGPTGSGSLGKLVINVAVVGNRLALAEALTFGTTAGMDPEAVLAILKDGSSYSRAMDLKGDKMVRRDYTPESTLAASLHGSELLLAEGRRVGAPMFLVSLYGQIAQVGVGMGYGAADPASLIEALRSMAERGKAQ